MKKKLILGAIISALCLLVYNVNEVYVNPLRYYINSDSTAEMSGVNSEWLKDYIFPSEIIIPSEVEIDGKKYTVTSIGVYAFSGCEDIRKIEIPSTITEIGQAAFMRCKGLTNIEIPSSIGKIGDRAFYGCTGLKRMIIPSSVNYIGREAFGNCVNLNVVIDNSKDNVETAENAFIGCKAVSYCITKIKYDFVDLNLPSGTLWATSNVGTSSIEGYGDSFSWGSTESLSRDKYYRDEKKIDKDGFSYDIRINGYIKYVTKSHAKEYGCEGFYDDKTTLELCDDVANKLMGEEWRMPTAKEYQELIDNCNKAWCSYKGVSGYKFTAKNGTWIFFPVEENGVYGDYWTSSLDPNKPCYAKCFFFNINKVGIGSDDRSDNFCVRGVKK